MGLFDKIIRGAERAVNNAVSNAVEQKVTEAVTPAANAAVNQAAQAVTPPPVSAQPVDAQGAEVLAQWDTVLPQYPKWPFGGHNMELKNVSESNSGYPVYIFIVYGVGEREVDGYSQLVKQAGFRTAGQYPSEGQLYKRVNGLVYMYDREHAFEVSENISLYFTVQEPKGGFDYQGR